MKCRLLEFVKLASGNINEQIREFLSAIYGMLRVAFGNLNGQGNSSLFVTQTKLVLNLFTIKPIYH